MEPNTLSNYNFLLHKLRAYKRKYYLNQMLRGGLFFLALGLMVFLAVALSEYWGRFSTGLRTALFYGLIAALAYLLVRYIAIPLGHLYGLGRTLNDAEAAELLGTHFPEVQDKLLNTLQLRAQADGQGGLTRALIEHSIEQKTAELRPIPFTKAVDFGSNRRYLRYAAIPLLILVVILAASPGMLLESTQRLVLHNRETIDEAPFRFSLRNKSLDALRQEDFPIELEITGDEMPAEVYAVVDGNPYKMQRDGRGKWTHTLRNLQRNVALQFTASGYASQQWNINVHARPALLGYTLKLDYPAYLGRKNETLENVGDLSVPVGTRIQWQFNTENADQLQLTAGGKPLAVERRGESLFTYSARIMEDAAWTLRTGNKYLPQGDSAQYFINALPDAYPTISVEEAKDSALNKLTYFTGQVGDDHGFTRLSFNYQFLRSDSAGRSLKPQAIPLNIDRGRTIQTFFHQFDFALLGIQPGDEIEYYFQVWDNDGVHGAKSARSQRFVYQAPSLKEIESTTSKNSQSLKDNLQSVMKKAEKLQKELDAARIKLAEKKSLDWQDKKMLDDLLKKHEQMQKEVQDLQKQMKENLQQQTEFKPIDEELMKRHQQLQEMLNQIMDDDTKKMLQEMQKLLEKGMKDEIQKQLQDMKFGDKEVQKELDRMQEMYKQLEMDQLMEQAMDKLDKLAEEQEKLSEQADSKQKSAEELAKEQEKLNEKFEDLKKDLEELDKKNEELEEKRDLGESKEDQKEIGEEMKGSKENLQKNNKNKAKEQQKKAAEKMKELSKKMGEQMEAEAQEKAEEDYQSLRQIMDNLIYVSMAQEQLMDELKQTPSYNPKYVEIGQRQRQLKDDARMIEDSLLALSKRVPEISTFVNKEVGDMNANIERTIENLGARNTPGARTTGQYSMTNMNNLAVMLSEIMENMQEQMKQSKNQKPGKGNKKGKGKPKPGDQMNGMKNLQEQLGKQLEQLKQGKMPGQGMSKELAQMVARQQMIRQQMQQLQQELTKDGKKPGDMQKIQELMDKNEEDIVNKRITPETIKRQQEIMTRMLESEKALKEQDEQEQRKAEEAKDKPAAPPPAYQKYLEQKRKETELLQTLPPSLTPYYKEKVREYFEELR